MYVPHNILSFFLCFNISDSTHRYINIKNIFNPQKSQFQFLSTERGEYINYPLDELLSAHSALHLIFIILV